MAGSPVGPSNNNDDSHHLIMQKKLRLSFRIENPQNYVWAQQIY